jgi:hypothetical protein
LFRLAGEVDKDAAALGHKDSEAWRISQADHGQQGGTAIWPQRQPEHDLLWNLTLSAILPVLGS